MGNVIEVTDADFEEKVLKSDKVVVVDFWAEWCGPCKMMAPVFKELAGERDDIVFAKVDVDQNQKFASQLGIRGIPALLLFSEGEVIDTMVGARPKADIAKWLDAKAKSGPDCVLPPKPDTPKPPTAG